MIEDYFSLSSRSDGPIHKIYIINKEVMARTLLEKKEKRSGKLLFLFLNYHDSHQLIFNIISNL